MSEKGTTGIVNFFRRIIHNKVFLSSSFIMIVSFLGGVINFGFNILMGRMLGQEQYGIVYPLISLSMIIGLPAKALLYVMTKDFSELIHHGKSEILKKLLNKFLTWINIVTLSIILVLFLFLPQLKAYLHIVENTGFYLLFLYILISTWSTPYNSLIQSRERFFWAGIGQFMTVAVKFVVGFLIVKQTLQYYGVLWGIVGGATFTLLLYFFDSLGFQSLNHENKNEIKSDLPIEMTQKYSSSHILRSFFLALISIGFFQLITYFDSVLVRHLLPDLSGVYSVANQMGKASFFIATGVSFVLLPFMSKDKKDIRKNNLRGLLFLLVFLLAYVAVITLGKDLIADKLFQGKYPGLEDILPLYTVMFIPYAAISYLVNYYFLSQKLLYSFTILGGAVLQIAGIYLFHANLLQVTLVVGATGYLVLLVLLIDSFILKDTRHLLEGSPGTGSSD